MTITTTPTLVVEKSLFESDIQNTGETIIYIARTAADCDITSTIQLNPGDAWFGTGPLYACVSSGTGILAILPPAAG